MHNDNTMPGLARAAREAEAVRDWLRETGEDLASAAYVFGGTEYARQACCVVASVRDGEDLSCVLLELRDLRDLLVSAVWGDRPIVILEGGQVCPVRP